jgi:nucleoside-diphosphate-sugar epimerase
VIPTFIYKALHKEALPLENGGIASRDFIYVDDIVRGLLLCAARGAPGDVYNLASGVETSIKALAEMINRLTDNPIPPKNLPKRDWDRSGKRIGSTEKSFRELGFKADLGIEDGLRRTIAWTKENLQYIEQRIDKHRPFMERI